MSHNRNLPVGPGDEDDDDLLDEKLIDTLIQDGLFDEPPLVDEVEIVDDVDVYQEDFGDDDSVPDVMEDQDAEDIEDEIDSFYGEDGKRISPPADADDDLL